MAPTKKVAVKSLTKGGLADAVAQEVEMKRSEVTKVLNSLAGVAAKEVKKGKFVIPGVCMIKTRTKPATKAGERVIGIRNSYTTTPRGWCIEAFAVLEVASRR